MLLETVAKFGNKMVEMCHHFISKLTIIPNSSRPIPTFPFFMEKLLKLNDVRDEKRIFGIMNFQKKSRNGNDKKIFKRI